jgi:hypothetical protein
MLIPGLFGDARCAAIGLPAAYMPCRLVASALKIAIFGIMHRYAVVGDRLIAWSSWILGDHLPKGVCDLLTIVLHNRVGNIGKKYLTRLVGVLDGKTLVRICALRKLQEHFRVAFEFCRDDLIDFLLSTRRKRVEKIVELREDVVVCQ